jgi:hypothetical protein
MPYTLTEIENGVIAKVVHYNENNEIIGMFTELLDLDYNCWKLIKLMK